MKHLFKKTITSNASAFTFAVFALFTASFNKHMGDLFVDITVIILISFLIVYVISALIDIINAKRWHKMIHDQVVYEEINFEWRVNEKGDFDARHVYSIKNISKKPISILPFDNALWLTKPKKLNISCKIISNGHKCYRIKEHRSSLYTTILSLISKQANVVAWSYVVEPAIDPGEILKYEMLIHSEETETDAFDANGTYAGIPSVIATKSANLTFAAPTGYKFDLLNDLIVLDNNEQQVTSPANLPYPVLSQGLTFLNWNLTNMLPRHRYWFKYKFIKA